MTPAITADAVLAAGAVVWREGDKGVEVLLVERAKHRDLSLPKGKLDPGETLPECASREIAEETGIAVRLDAPLGTSEYRLPDGRDKIVYYWQAEARPSAVAASDFVPNDEIHALQWMRIAKAKQAVTYGHDVTILERFEANLAVGAARTLALTIVRHGKAADPYGWDGPDATRELTDRGRKQAIRIAAGLAAFGPVRVIASTAIRCMQTVAPLATLIGVEPRPSKSISQDERGKYPDSIERKVRKAIAKRRSTVFCSHLPVIPVLVSAIVHETDAEKTPGIQRAANLHTADFSVFHILPGDQPRLIAYETHSAP